MKHRRSAHGGTHLFFDAVSQLFNFGDSAKLVRSERIGVGAGDFRIEQAGQFEQLVGVRNQLLLAIGVEQAELFFLPEGIAGTDAVVGGGVYLAKRLLRSDFGGLGRPALRAALRRIFGGRRKGRKEGEASAETYPSNRQWAVRPSEGAVREFATRTSHEVDRMRR